jgi:hypothetical protein
MKIAGARIAIDFGLLTAILDEETNGIPVGMVHATIHGKDEVLPLALQCRRQNAKMAVHGAFRIAVEQLYAVAPGIKGTEREWRGQEADPVAKLYRFWKGRSVLPRYSCNAGQRNQKE